MYTDWAVHTGPYVGVSQEFCRHVGPTIRSNSGVVEPLHMYLDPHYGSQSADVFVSVEKSDRRQFLSTDTKTSADRSV